jgi:hypothetical protein
MIRTILIALVALTAYACKAPQPCVSTHTETVIRKDSVIPYLLPGDSAVFEALLRCDSSGRVLLAAYTSETSKRFMAEFSLANNTLRYKAQSKKDTIYLAQKHYYKETLKITEPRAPEPQRTPWWKKFLMWTGVATLLYIGVRIAIRFFLPKIPI